MPTEYLILLQLILTVTTALANGNAPTADQLKALADGEAAIKAKLDADLAKVVAAG